jgi:hypothetical protein
MGSFWFAFSALLSGPMKWFVHFPIVAIIGGMIGGPFSYWGGAQMEGLIFPDDWKTSLYILGVLWGVSMALYTWVTHSIMDDSRVRP